MTSAADATRARLLAAARGVFATKGFSRARMGDIAQEAEVSRQALYYHFHSKHALAGELVRAGLAALGEEVRAALRDGPPESVVPLLLRFYLRNTDLAQLLLLQQVDVGLDLRELRAMGLDVLVHPLAKRLGEECAARRSGALDPRIAALAIVGAINAGALDVLLGDGGTDVDLLADELTTYVRRITAVPGDTATSTPRVPEIHP